MCSSSCSSSNWWGTDEKRIKARHKRKFYTVCNVASVSPLKPCISLTAHSWISYLSIILSNFDQFVTPMWLWHAWRNFISSLRWTAVTTAKFRQIGPRTCKITIFRWLWHQPIRRIALGPVTWTKFRFVRCLVTCDRRIDWNWTVYYVRIGGRMPGRRTTNRNLTLIFPLIWFAHIWYSALYLLV